MHSTVSQDVVGVFKGVRSHNKPVTQGLISKEVPISWMQVVRVGPLEQVYSMQVSVSRPRHKECIMKKYIIYCFGTY